MLLKSACFVALLSCALFTRICTGINVIKIALEKRHKYGELSLESLKKHVQTIKQLEKDSNGVVPMYNFADMYYFGEIGMGTPGQRFNMSFSTGSADFWMLAKIICSIPRWASICSSHKTFDSKKSSTFKRKGKRFSIMSGMLEGVLSQDSMTVGDLRVPKLVFGQVTNLTDDTPLSRMYDGMFGLAYPEASQLHIDPPFVNMVKHKIVDQPVFAFYLNKNSLPGGERSELVLGGMNPKHYKGDLVYTDVVQKSYYMIAIKGVNVGTREVISNIKTIISTGTSLIYGPSDYMDTINKAIGGKPSYFFYYVNCDKIPSMPNITIFVEKTPLVLKPEDFIIKFADGTCVSGLVGLNMDYLVLGDVFLRPFYSVYDMGKNRVGFAPAV